MTDEMVIGEHKPEAVRVGNAMLAELNNHQLRLEDCIDAAMISLVSVIVQSSDSPKAICILAQHISRLIVPMTTKTFSDPENRKRMGMPEEQYQRELAEIEFETMKIEGGNVS